MYVNFYGIIIQYILVIILDSSYQVSANFEFFLAKEIVTIKPLALLEKKIPQKGVLLLVADLCIKTSFDLFSI